MHSLLQNADVCRLLASRLTVNNRLCLAWSCHRWMQLVPSCRGILSQDFIRNFTIDAAVIGSLNQLKWLYRTYGFISHASYCAGAYGHLEILLWLNKNGVKPNFNHSGIMTAAALRSHFSVLNWFKCNGVEISYDFIVKCAEEDRYDIVEWAIKFQPDVAILYPRDNKLALALGGKALVRFEKHLNNDLEFIQGLIIGDHVELLKERWGKASENPTGCWVNALKSGSLKCLNYLFERGPASIPVNAYDIAASSRNTNIATFEWLLIHNHKSTHPVYCPRERNNSNYDWLQEHREEIW